ncbi:MAG: geranylgeranylglycerol-phosphate geranylgeranyltransferase [Phaeodactylibacter sp.]|uniref:geranylgeranylglycerol-phosphate geranylgeranyltransferase n=1 Tax=Phaeodactylibacter sp. TaxID=1940289 RepID=UPI0032EAE9E4
MNVIYAFFRLIRLPNLLIVGLTQYLIYGALLLPAFRQYGIPMALPPQTFWLFVLDAILITAAGYVINDIIDFRIDLQNRPERVVLGRYIRKQTAYWIYFSTILLGFFLAFYLALSVQNPPLLALYPAAVGLLFWYSFRLKQLPLSGNLLISLFCAGVPGVVWFAEREGFTLLAETDPAQAAGIAKIIVWYLLFAFGSTLYRELIKDMEDMEGDKSAGCRTVPIVWGMGTAKGLAAATGTGLLVLIVTMAAYQQAFFSLMSHLYVTVALIGPLGLSLFLLFRAKQPVDYHRLSTLTKLIMLSGVILLLFFAFN